MLKAADTDDGPTITFSTNATEEDAFSYYEKWCADRGGYIRQPYNDTIDMLIAPLHDIKKAVVIMVAKGATLEDGSTIDKPCVIIAILGGDIYDSVAEFEINNWRKALPMITDKQFDDAFTSAGGWFLLTQYETIASWKGSKTELVDFIYSKGFDSKRAGSSTRVSSALNIINNNRGREALIKIRDSKAINRAHPEAYDIASSLLKQI